jgi:hypothetical protein
MSHYDFFVAHLECPHCGAISPKDASTELYTYIRDPPPGVGVGCELGVGDSLGDIVDCVLEYEGANYVTIHEPNWDEEIRILQSWRCPNCRTWGNWAEIVIRRGVIESISATRLTRDVFERSHFIKDMDAGWLAAELMHCPVTDMSQSRPNLVRILRERLE